MRRRRSVDEGMPRWLLEPSRADWPNPGCHWECRYWEAVSDWQERNPDAVYPPGIGPDGPFHPELI